MKDQSNKRHTIFPYNTRRKKRSAHIIRFCSIGILLLLYAPLLHIIAKGLHFSNIIHIITTASYYNMFLFTLFQASISTLGALLVGFSVASVISNYDFFGKAFIRILSLIPFIVPTIIVVLGFVIVWGNNGIINKLLSGLAGWLDVPHSNPIFPLLYSFPAIIIAHTFYNFGICTHIISASWSTLPDSHIKAAENLGASRFQIYRHIIIPHLLPSIKTSSIIVFLFCFTSFAIVLILGGGPWYSTIEVMIYKLIRIDFDMNLASSLALIQMTITLLIAFVFLKSQHTPMKTNKKTVLPPLSKAQYKWSIRIYMVILYTLVILPFIAIIFVSLFEKSTRAGIPHLSIMPYITLITNPYIWRGILHSIVISIASAGIAFTIALIISIVLHTYKNNYLNTIINLVLFIPYFISPIIVSLAYISLRTLVGQQSLLLIILVHAILSLPFLIRIMTIGLHSIHPNIIYAAKNLGATQNQLLTSMYIPLITPSIIIAISLSLCLSLGELSAALILMPSRQPTIPLILYEFLGKYRFLDATRMGVILIIITMLILIIINTTGRLLQRRTFCYNALI